MTEKVLFVLPPSQELYANSKVKVAVPERPSLTFATLAAPLTEAGHSVQFIDLDRTHQPEQELKQQLDAFSPDYVGITCTTPLVYKVQTIATTIKQYNDGIVVMAGGPHPSSLIESVMLNSDIDIACIGEGDYTIMEIVSDAEWSTIKGIGYNKNGSLMINPVREQFADLDDLPFPAWSMFNLHDYKTPHLSCRKNPVGTMETSRGCVFGCTYCNKNIFGRSFRVKSPARVVDEMEYMLKSGFREIHINDDGFTTNLNRAKEICDLIIRRGLKFPWNLYNGVRVDRVDKEFLSIARAAGCYGMTFGVESGDQSILQNIGKKITLEQARQAFQWARECDIETLAFFMLGLPGETEETMQRTLNFAVELDPDYAKASILLPLPGTQVFSEFDSDGFIKSKDWSLYNQHEPSGVYDHPNLPWETIEHYYSLFHKKFYFRPKAVWRQFRKDAFSTRLFYDLTYAIKTKW